MLLTMPKKPFAMIVPRTSSRMLYVLEKRSLADGSTKGLPLLQS